MQAERRFESVGGDRGRGGASERFEGLSFLQRASTLLADLDPPVAVDVLCYTPREFGIVSQAVAEGVAL